jgi:hypothetical protein
MTIEEVAEFIVVPKYFGYPWYLPDGRPFQRECIIVYGETLQEKWIQRLHSTTHRTPPDQHDERLLVQWVLYYLYAPMWQMNPGGAFLVNELLESVTADISLEELISRCLDIGIDPF